MANCLFSVFGLEYIRFTVGCSTDVSNFSVRKVFKSGFVSALEGNGFQEVR